MKRWMMAVVAATGGGALIAMSAAQAAAFTPTSSTTAAVPAPELGSTLPVQQQRPLEGDRQQQRRLVWDLMKLPQLAVAGSTGLGGEQLREARMLDLSQPKRTDLKMQVFINPCPKLLATCATQVLVIGPLTGTTNGVARAYAGEEVLDRVVAPVVRW